MQRRDEPPINLGRLGVQIQLGVNVGDLKVGNGGLVRHPELFVSLSRKLQHSDRLGIAAAKKREVAHACFDLGDRNVHSCAARICQSLCIELLGSLKVVELGVRVRQTVFGHRLPRTLTEFFESAMRREAVLFRELVLIAPRNNIAEIHLDLSGGELVVVSAENSKSIFAREFRRPVLTQHRQSNKFRDQRLRRLVFLAEASEDL